MENNKLIPTQQNNLVNIVSSSLSITNKLLIEHDLKIIKEIFNNNPTLFINIISRYYPLSYELIDKYEDEWDWDLLSENLALPWSYNLLSKYKDNWNWKSLSLNKALPWSDEYIYTIYEEKLHWRFLSNSKFIPWTSELITKFIFFEEDSFQQNKKMLEDDKNYIRKKNVMSKARELYYKYDDKEKTNFISKIAFLEQFPHLRKGRTKSNCFYMSGNESIPWSEELIEKYLYEWNWRSNKYTNLSANRSLPWSEELIEKYRDKWNWRDLSKNESLPWTEKFISKYESKWNWKYLSGNLAIPWSIELITRFKTRWNWKYLSSNKSIPWSDQMFEKFDWNLYHLSKNESFSWSEDFIENNSERLDFKNLSTLKTVPWSEKFIEKYSDKWCWTSLSKNIFLPWSIDLINKYHHKWNWSCLSSNIALPWSANLVNNYHDKWNWNILLYALSHHTLSKRTIINIMHQFPENLTCSEYIWFHLKDYINDALVNEILN